MSLSLCFFQQKDIVLANNEIQIPFQLKAYRFLYKPLKSIFNRLQPELRKRMKQVQVNIDKALASTDRKMTILRGFQKMVIILLIGLLVGIYYMTLQGADTDQDAFQIGVYILAGTGIALILLQIICIFLFHSAINYVMHEIQLVLLNETQRCGNLVQWRLHRGCSSIIFSYSPQALMTASQMLKNMEGSQKNQYSEEMFMKPKQKSKHSKNIQDRFDMISKEDDEKEMVKNQVFHTEDEPQIYSGQQLDIFKHRSGQMQEQNEREEVKSDYDDILSHQSNRNEINIGQKGNSKQNSRYNGKEIMLQQNDINIEMTPQGEQNKLHIKGLSNVSNKSKQSVKETPYISKAKENEEVLKFDSGEEDLNEDVVSEKHSQNKGILNVDQLSSLNKTGQLGNIKGGIPLVLDLNTPQLVPQHNSANFPSYRIDNDSNLLTGQTLRNNQSNLYQNEYNFDQSPILKHKDSADTPENAKQQNKKSNFNNYLLNRGDSDQVGDEVESEDEEENTKKQKQQQSKNNNQLNPPHTSNDTLNASPQQMKVSPHLLNSSNSDENVKQEIEKLSQLQSEYNPREDELIQNEKA